MMGTLKSMRDLFAVAALFTGLSSMGAVTITCGNASGAVGASAVEVVVSVENTEALDVVQLQLTISYDQTKLTAVDDGANGMATLASGVVFDQNNFSVATPGVIQVALGTFSQVGVPSGHNGPAFSIHFDVAAGADAGDVDLQVGKVPNGVVAGFTPVDPTVADGTFTVLKFYNAIADAQGVGEDDGTAAVAVLANDVDETETDVSADAMVDSIDTNGTTGAASLDAGVVSYSPNGQFEMLAQGEQGADTFTYTGSYTHPTEGAVTDTGTVTIAVTGVNDAPVFTSDPAGLTPTDEDAVYTYNITATDVDNGAILTIAATTKPGWLTLTDNGDGTATLTGTPLNDDVGDNDVVLTVSDGIAADVPQSFTVVVANTNDDPTVANPIADQPNVTEDAAFSFIIPANTFEDVDVGDALTLTSDEALDWLTFSDNGDGTATLSGTPTNSTDAGTTAVAVTADDGNGGTPPQDAFDITVTAINDDPVIAAPVGITPNSALLSGGDITATVTASDEETILGELDYAYVWKSGETVIKDTGNLTGVNTSTLTEAEQVGLGEHYPITVDVTVTDGDAATDTGSAATYVGNEPPTIAWNGTSTSPVNEGDTITIEVQVDDTGHAPQADDIATLTLTVDGTPATPTPTPVLDGATGTLTFTIDTDQNTSTHTADKEFTVEVTVTDTEGATDSAQQKITVTDVNTDPEITSVTIGQVDQGTAAPLVPEDLEAVVAADDADAEDSGNLTYTYVWKKDGQVLAGAGDDDTLTVGEQDAAGFADGDSYEITLEVTVADTRVPAGTDTLMSAATTIGNEPPAIAWDGTSTSPVNEGDTITVAVQVDDAGHAPQPDNITNLTSTVDGTPVTPTPTPVLDGVTGALTFTIETDQDTSTHAADKVFTVEVTVTDAAGSSATADQMITVTDVNSLPAITGTPATSVDQDAAYTFTPAVTDDDAEDQALVGVTQGDAFSIQNKPGWANFDTATGELSGTPTNADVGGTYNDIAIAFTDGDGAQAPLAAFDIVVNNVNDAPMADADEDATDEDTPKAIDVLTGDTDIDISGQFGAANVDGDALSVSAVTQPANGVVTNSGTGVTFDPDGQFEALDDQGTALLTFNYTLSDGQGGEDEATVTVTVNGVNDAPVIGGLRITGEGTPSRDTMTSVSLSKPEEIDQLVVNASSVTTDVEGNNIAYTYVWTLEREGGITTRIQGPAVVGGNTAFLSKSDVGGAFLKDDKVTVEVTATDDSTDPKQAIKTKSVTLGNPPWFPGLEWEAVDNAESYRIVITDDQGNEVVTLYTIDPSVKPANYLQSRNWTDSPTVKGLAPGNYTVEVTPEIDGEFGDSLDPAPQLDPVEYDSLTGADALARPPTQEEMAALEDGTPLEQLPAPAQRDGLVGGYFSPDYGVYAFFAEITEAAGYIYALQDTATESVMETELVAFLPNDDGAVSTSEDIVRTVQVTAPGTYGVAIIPVTPDYPDGVPDESAYWEFTVDQEDVGGIAGAAEDKPPVVTAAWGMIPGGDTASFDAILAPYATVDESGEADITFRWNTVLWAASYRIYIEDEFGNQVPELSFTTATAPEHSLIGTLAPGRYLWHVIAQNDNGYTEWSNPAAHFEVQGSTEDADAATLLRVNTPGVTITDLDLDVANKEVTVDYTVDKAAVTSMDIYLYDMTARAEVGIFTDAAPEANGGDVLAVGVPLLGRHEYFVQIQPTNMVGGVTYLGEWSDSATVVAPDAGAAGVIKTPVLTVVDPLDKITVTATAALVAEDTVTYGVYLLTSLGALSTSMTASVTGETAYDIILSDAFQPVNGNLLLVRARAVTADGTTSAWVGKSWRVVNGAYVATDL